MAKSGKNKSSKGKGKVIQPQQDDGSPGPSNLHAPSSLPTPNVPNANVPDLGSLHISPQPTGSSSQAPLSLSTEVGSQVRGRVVSTEVVQSSSSPDYSTPTLDMAKQRNVSQQGSVDDYDMNEKSDERENFMERFAELKKNKKLTMDVTKRKEFVFTKDEFLVRTNYFSMDFEFGQEKNPNRLYIYNIEGINSDAPRPEKRALVKSLINRCALLQQQKDDFATDYLEQIVAWKDLSLHGNVNKPAKKGQELAQIDVPVPGSGRFGTANATSRTLTVVFKKTFEYKNINDFVEGRGNSMSGDYKQLDQALHIIISKALQEQSGDSIIQIGTSKIFPKAGHDDLTNTKVAIRGYTYSHHQGMGAHFLNVNPSMSVFHRPMSVSDYISGDPSLTKDLIGVKVWVNFTRSTSPTDRKLDERQRRTKTIVEFGRKTASQQEAYKDKNKTPVSVYNHIKGKYGQRSVGTRQSVCVNVGGTDSGTKVWFMAEDLIILPYQQFRGDMSPDLTSAMITKACRRPKENLFALTSEFTPLLGIKDSKGLKEDLETMPKVLKNAKIRIYPQLACVPAYQTAIPEVRYRGTAPRTTPENGMWKLRKQLKFLSGGQVNGSVHVLIPGQGMGLSVQQQSQYLTLFFNHCTANGVDLSTPFTGLEPSNHTVLNGFSDDDVRSALQAACNGNAGLVMLLFPDNSKAYLQHYALFKKLCDQEFGVVSVCLCEKKVRTFFPNDIIDDNSKFAGYAMSVGAKLNVRLGSNNHGVTRLSENIPDFRNDIMILGADVVHPGHGAQQYTPSCAAVVGSVDADFTKYLGSARHQEGREEIIQDMQTMVEERLRAYKKHNSGRVPTRIVYYRDGVDEGKFSGVRDVEVKAIKDAWNVVIQNTGVRNIELKVTTVVVTKRHSTRIYPTDEGPQLPGNNENCLPGTVVESGITWPYHFDFYLLSQKAIQGTGRPAHYIVLSNEINFTPGQLHNFTNILCYTYCRSTTAVSYVPAAYYADHLCERVKQYLRGWYDNTADFDGTENEAEQQLRAEWGQGGRPYGNPWREELDDTMFWM